MTKPSPRAAAACALAAATLALPALAAATSRTAPPVGPLPNGPVTTVSAPRGTLVSVALPRQKESTGRVWRLARQVNPKVLRQVSEADVGSSVVVVFRAVGKGRTTVAFALTRGESSPKALRAIRHVVRVR